MDVGKKRNIASLTVCNQLHLVIEGPVLKDTRKSSLKTSVHGFALTYSVPLLGLPIDQTIKVLRRQEQRRHNRLLLGIHR